jgi:uncharacterized DUF497 family protein
VEIEQLLIAAIGFQWDSANIDKIWAKHLVAPEEAEQVFFNTPRLLLPDPGHSRSEERFQILGKTDAGRLLFVSWTFRNMMIRVISARHMSRKERAVYAKEA